jgi:serine/threonine protein kinase
MKNLPHVPSVLKDFEVLEENRVLDTFISYTVCSRLDRTSRFRLTRETVDKTPETLARAEALVKAKEIGILRATSVTVEHVNSMFMVYTLTPLEKDGISLHCLLLQDTLTNSQKGKIFKNLANTLCSLQELGTPYLELCPENVLIESKSIVYLKPFKIVPDVYNDDYFYASPELLSGISYFTTIFAEDVWSLGCIYAELFLSLTPLFQAPSIDEKLLKMFLVLGTPSFTDVESYMTWETYQELKTLASHNKENLHKMVFSGVTWREKDMILNMLSFSVEKRCDVKTVAFFNWQDDERLEVLEEKTSFLDERQKTNWMIDRSFEPLFSANSDLCSDNTLQVTLKSAINLDLFKFCAEEYYLVFSYELDTGTAIQSVSTPVIKASVAVNIDFTREFSVNSNDLKRKYRTSPFVIRLSQCMVLGDKRREDSLGVCEAYLGLLFSSNGDNTVQGWYNITSGRGILGQILIEVKTKAPLKKEDKDIRITMDPPVNQDRILIKDITMNLGNLTSQLLSREDTNQKKEQDDLQFAETLKKLRKLLLDKN